VVPFQRGALAAAKQDGHIFVNKAFEVVGAN
jgi:hypothetical protein